jgi:hypothetical protein
LQAGSRDRSDMARRKQDRGAKPPTRGPDETDQDPLTDDLIRALRGFFSIPGVEGIGRPVTVLSPYNLPPDLLGLVQRPRSGAVEVDEEMILPAIPTPRGQRRGRHPVADRLRRSFHLLCRHSWESEVPAGVVMALLDGSKRDVVARAIMPGRGPFTGSSRGLGSSGRRRRSSGTRRMSLGNRPIASGSLARPRPRRGSSGTSRRRTQSASDSPAGCSR